VSARVASRAHFKATLGEGLLTERAAGEHYTSHAHLKPEALAALVSQHPRSGRCSEGNRFIYGFFFFFFSFSLFN
jgi:hypothetical protein